MYSNVGSMASLAEDSGNAAKTKRVEESVSGGQRLGGKDGEQSFFYYYGQLAHQQNMLQDTTRTGAYYNAICGQARAVNFQGKVVMDVGTGTGILAMFAAKAGAKKVYAVEASAIASTAKELVKANGLGDVVEVFNCKVRLLCVRLSAARRLTHSHFSSSPQVEELELPEGYEKADVIVSESMGFLLVHERMLEVMMIARDRFLKKGGLVSF